MARGKPISQLIPDVRKALIEGMEKATEGITYDLIDRGPYWSGLFANIWMKVATMLVLTAVLIHGWIGIWQVLTDYVKAAGLRAFIQLVFSVGLIAVWLTGLFVLWGV